jgi:hypothetical protein
METQIAQLKLLVSRHTKVAPENFDVISDRNPLELTRRREYVLSRKLVMAMMKKHTTKSLVDIGAIWRIAQDHTTVMHAVTSLNNLIETDKRIREIYENIDKRAGKILEIKEEKKDPVKERIEKLEANEIRQKQMIISLNRQIRNMKSTINTSRRRYSYSY